MESPFINVEVLPHYGQFEARIAWSVEPGYRDGEFIVQKSPDGIEHFETIASGQGMTSYVDDNLLTRGRVDTTYYKVLLQKDDQLYQSQPIGTFGRLTRHEFGTAQAIMEQEARNLRHFTRVLIFNRRVFGPRCPRCVDPDTGQKIGIDRCPRCYGTSYDGGFRSPVESYAQMKSISANQRVNTQAGQVDVIKVEARMLAFPEMWQGDLIVDVDSDKRYEIDEAGEISYVNGKVPLIAGSVKMELLPRNDIKYQLPIEEAHE